MDTGGGGGTGVSDGNDGSWLSASPRGKVDLELFSISSKQVYTILMLQLIKICIIYKN